MYSDHKSNRRLTIGASLLVCCHLASIAQAADRVTSIIHLPGMTQHQVDSIHHDLVRANVPRSTMHSSARKPDGGVVVVDVWQTRADFETYKAAQLKAAQDAGVSINITDYVTANLIGGGSCPDETAD